MTSDVVTFGVAHVSINWKAGGNLREDGMPGLLGIERPATQRHRHV